MIKQLKKTNDIDEANRLLDSGWILLAENIEFVLLGLPNKPKKEAHHHNS